MRREEVPIITVRDPEEWRAYCRSLSARGTVGFVPTMGALHAGHLSLVRLAKAENDFALASVFVNPTQFDDPSDLRSYPRPLEVDLAMLSREGVSAAFVPAPEAMYPDSYRYRVSESDFSHRLCGAFRPGHFDGMLTVVLKMLLLTGAESAYFGEKDFQQYSLVRDMAAAFFLETRIVPCPIAREPNGLAMSSRNERLSPADRRRAGALFRAISRAPTAEAARRVLEAADFGVEYVEEAPVGHDGAVRRLAAARLGGVRLIDNVPLQAGGRHDVG